MTAGRRSAPGETYTYTITVGEPAGGRVRAERDADRHAARRPRTGEHEPSRDRVRADADLEPRLTGPGRRGVLDRRRRPPAAPGRRPSVTVTVKVLPSATGSVVNTASASAPDPAAPTTTLSAQGTDTDQLQRLTVAKSSNAAAAGVRAGDVVTYTVTLIEQRHGGLHRRQPGSPGRRPVRRAR